MVRKSALNADLVSYLEELKKSDDVCRSDKLVFTLARSIKGIRSHPVKINSGEQARNDVKGVGNWCAQQIDHFFKYIGAQAASYTPSTEIGSQQQQQSSLSWSVSQPVDVPPAGDVVNKPPKSSLKSKEIPKKSKPYCPKDRSGGYAILLSLLQAELDYPPRLSITKEEIVKRGEPLCDTTFEKPAIEGKYFNAWTSMRTLKSKELVISVGKKQFALTDAGRNIALDLQSKLNQSSPQPETISKDVDFGVDVDTGFDTDPFSDSPTQIEEDRHDDFELPLKRRLEFRENPGLRPSSVPKCSDNISTEGIGKKKTIVSMVDVVDNTDDDEDSDIEVIAESQGRSHVQNSQNYVPPTYSNMFSKDPKADGDHGNGGDQDDDDNMDDSFLKTNDYDDLLFGSVPDKDSDINTTLFNNVEEDAELRSILRQSEYETYDDSSALPTMTTTTTTTTTSVATRSDIMPAPLSITPVKSRKHSSSISKKKQPISTHPPLKDTPTRLRENRRKLFVNDFQSLPMNVPSSYCRYEVVCICDNREKQKDWFGGGGDFNSQQHGSSSKRLLCDLLKDAGVKAESRPLSVGDVMWIARPIGAGAGGGQDEELVLDVIIERKSISDFISSISDGRYKEQKFRLSSTGLGQIVYLVEGVGLTYRSVTNSQSSQRDAPDSIVDSITGFDSQGGGGGGGGGDQSSQSLAAMAVAARSKSKYAHHHKMGGGNNSCSQSHLEKVRTAMAACILHNGIFIKRTADSRGTIEYLVQVTRALGAQVTSTNWTKRNLFEFNVFQEAASKSKNSTVQMMWGKMLCQIYGISGDVAQIILER